MLYEVITPARRDAFARSGLSVAVTRVGNVQGQMVVALRIAPIDNVTSFRGSLVPELKFGANGILPQGDRIGAYHGSALHQVEKTVRFADDDAINFRYAAGESICCAAYHDERNNFV